MTDFPPDDIPGIEDFEPLARPSVEALDSILGEPFGVLDHGFIRVVDYMGDEAAICQAARVSYGKGTKTVNEDRGLLRYLLSHWHTTPFEMCEIKLHVKLPIFVARQWIRHRTANVNEYSARYSILKSEFYLPEHRHLAPQSTSNKQGREGEYSTAETDRIRRRMAMQHDAAYACYADLIDEDGFELARESARAVLPLSTYTEWYWKVDLHNLLHFLRLRADPHAQYEIRAYAEVICNLVEAWLPNVWEAFVDYQLESVTLSRMEVERLKDYIEDLRYKIDDEGVGSTKLYLDRGDDLSTRELTAFGQKARGLGCDV